MLLRDALPQHHLTISQHLELGFAGAAILFLAPECFFLINLN